MVYNRANLMQRRFSGSARLLFILVLLVTFGTAGSAVRRPQATAGQADFARAAAAALAHGKRDDAEKMATARGASDPAAAVVLAQLAVGARQVPRGAGDARADRGARAGGRGRAGARAAVSHHRPERRRAADSRHDLPARRDVFGSGRAAARRARGACAQSSEGSQDVFPGGRAGRRRSGRRRDRVRAPLPRQVQSGRSAEVVPGRADRRSLVGARDGRARARPGRRGSAQGRRVRDEGDRDRSRARRSASAARRAAPRRRSRRRGAGRDRQGPRVQSVAARGARDARGDGLREGRQGDVRPRSGDGSRDQPGLRRGLPAHRPAGREPLPLRRSGGAGREGAGPRPDEQPCGGRPGHAPDAHRRRARRAPRAGSIVARRSVRRRHLQPAGAARHPRPVHHGQGRGHRPQDAPGRGRGPPRIRDAARAGRAQDPVGALRLHADRPDPRRDLPDARRLRGAQPRACPA